MLTISVELQKPDNPVSAFDNYFLAAQRLRQRLKREMDDTFRRRNPLRTAYTPDEAGVDVLIFPTAISPPPSIEKARESGDGVESYVQDILTVPASLAGLPAVSIPVSRSGTNDGQPALPAVGVQIVGQWGHDEMVLSVAEALQEGLRQ